MTNTATKTYQVTVIERALAYYKVEAEDARAAAQNWDEGEFYDRDDEALDAEGPCNVRERQPDGTWRIIPPSEWEDEPAAASDPGKDRYVIHSADANGYWSDAARWSGIEAAHVFTASEQRDLRLPLGGRWIALKPYSVLLLNPRYINDWGNETYYAFVEAPDAITAVALAQRDAVAAQVVDIDDPDDFAPLLVTAGHHYGEALCNKRINHEPGKEYSK